MKLIIVLITLGLSISNFKNKFLAKHSIVSRKLSTINRKNFMLVGFSDYHEKNEEAFGNLSFSIHSITNSSFPPYTNTNVSIIIQYANGTNEERTINCRVTTTNNMTNELKNSTYYCETHFLEAIPSNITAVIPKINFSFLNNTNLPLYTITENYIEKSSIANETINNLRKHNESIIYDTFYLKEIELNKSEFILKGNFSYNETQTYINLTLSGYKYNSSLTNDEIRFNASGNINDYLHGKMGETSQAGKYILIYALNGVNDYLSYPIPQQPIRVLYFANYTKPTSKENATNLLYFSGTQYALNNLKPYIRFNTTIYYNSLRNLEEYNNTITANGTLIDVDQIKKYAYYFVTYPGTANRNITFMTPPTSFEFSEDGTTYQKSAEEIITQLDVDLLEEGNIVIDRMGIISDLKDKTTTSFIYDFSLSDNSILYTNGTQKDAYLKYPSNNNNTKQEEIKCVIQQIQNFELPYRMICFPKKSVNTRINTIKIIINETSSNSRLRSLQSVTNRIIIPPDDAKGTINFSYSRYNYKKPSGGLSAGAIVAIVLATVAAVVALGLAILFLNRMKSTPPPIKNPSDLNIANSASNINN